VLTTGLGFRCPSCGGTDNEVKDSRLGDNYIRRRRKCAACGMRVTTVEVIVANTGPQQGTPESVFRAMQVRDTLDALPADKRTLVLDVLALAAGKEVQW
jgi:transcriptional regulator NrdR family protein